MFKTKIEKLVCFGLFFIIIQLGNKCFAQDNCIPEKVFHTDSLGSNADKIFFPLYLIISDDSINVCLDKAGKNKFISLKIVSTKCHWNSDFSKGKTIYQVILKESKLLPLFGTLTVNFDDPENKYIELLYDKSEPRIFTIDKSFNIISQ